MTAGRSNANTCLLECFLYSEITDGDIDETVMVFTVRDKQLSHNMLIGEAVLPLEKLLRDITQEERKSLPQIHLPLTLPCNAPTQGRFSLKTEAKLCYETK